MNLTGNYNLGIYNPPSGLDAVKSSQEAPTELALKLNNLKAGQETGDKQQVATSWPKFLDPDIDLITSLNNFDIEAFIHMLREGWRKDQEEIPPAPTFTSISTSISTSASTSESSPSFTMPALDPNCSYDFFILGLDQDKKFEDCIGYTSSESGQGWSFKKGNIPAGGSNAQFGEPVWDASKQRYNPVVTGKKQVIGIVEVRQLGYPRSVIEGDVIKGSAGTNTTVWDSVKIGGNITVPFVGGVGSNDTYRNVKGDYAMQVIPEMLKQWPYKLYWDVEIQFLKQCAGDDRPKLETFGPPPPPPLYRGKGGPPPPRRRMSNCCDCNTIASIIENQALAQLRVQEKLVENLKDHIDKRALEIIIKDLEHLKALDFEQFLKVILQRVNESESNLWNGIKQ